METEKFLLHLEETLAHVVRQQEAICAELVVMRERVDVLAARRRARSCCASSIASARARRSARPPRRRGSRSRTSPA